MPNMFTLDDIPLQTSHNGELVELTLKQREKMLVDWNKDAIRIENEEKLLYQKKRAAEYPPITDYLDGIVKGDQAQIDSYIAACQTVKIKYPKG